MSPPRSGRASFWPVMLGRPACLILFEALNWAVGFDSPPVFQDAERAVPGAALRAGQGHLMVGACTCLCERSAR